MVDVFAVAFVDEAFVLHLTARSVADGPALLLLLGPLVVLVFGFVVSTHEAE
jgi:hypothetical protein